MNLETTELIALAAALGWASGLRLYAVVFFTGIAGALGLVDLPAGLKVLEQPFLQISSGCMMVVEFFADKIPGIDSLWDIVHTAVRIPAGAALAAGVFGTDQATWATLAGLLGGTLAATSHVAKSTTRAAINTSPEPLSNVVISLLGDGLVPAGLWLSWAHPWLFLIALVIVLILMVMLIVVLGRFLIALVRRYLGWSGRARLSN